MIVETNKFSVSDEMLRVTGQTGRGQEDCSRMKSLRTALANATAVVTFSSCCVTGAKSAILDCLVDFDLMEMTAFYYGRHM